MIQKAMRGCHLPRAADDIWRVAVVDKKQLRIYITARFLPDVFITQIQPYQKQVPTISQDFYSQIFVGGGKVKR